MPEKADADFALAALLSREELHGEARINRLRLLGFGVFYLNELADYHLLGATATDIHHRLNVVSAWYAAFAVGSWALVNRRRIYHWSFKYAFALADTCFLSWAIAAGDGLTSPMASVFFIQIAAAGLRFSRAATFAAAVFSASAYLTLLYLRPVVTGYVAGIQVLAMLVMGLLAGQVVYQLRGLAFKLADTLLRRKKVEGALVRYVSRQVADEILRRMDAGSLGLSGERRYVTVLFSDLRGFSALAARSDPVELLALLNRYFQAMIDVVFRYEGTLDKFIGDALLVVFGAPLAQPDSEARALRCALEMRRALEVFNEEQRRQGRQTLQMGIGINAGEVVAGELGSEARMEYTVLGETVNLAERLQGKAEGGKILVSKAVRNRAPEEFRFLELPPLQVKGREEPIAAFELA